MEFDTWGQFFGLGTFPVSVVEDMQERMRQCLAAGVEGIALRTDWEVITDSGAFNSPNLLNVIGGAMLAQEVERDLSGIYDAWVAHGLLSPLRTASEVEAPVVPPGKEARERLEAFMKASWNVMERAAYVRGHLFHEDDQYPDTLDKAFGMMVDIHGRDDWEPGASRLVQPTGENIAVILEEKRAALEGVRRLPGILSVGSLGLPPTMAAEFEVMLDLYERWVRGFEFCARTVFLTRRAERSKAPGDVEAALATLAPMRGFVCETAARLEGTHFPHYVYWMLDTTRLEALAADAERRLAALPALIGSAR